MTNTIDINGLPYMLVGDITVGTATTSVSFTGLDIGKDDDYLLVSDIPNPSGGTYYLYANGNTTNTNYYQQRLNSDSTTVTAARGNTATLFDGTSPFMISKIKLTNSGYFVSQSEGLKNIGTSTIVLYNWYTTSTFTASSITQLTITAINANAIVVGSRFQLYKLVAEKVADIIVTTATTSVDITGLNIGKDGEYMLVSDVYNTSGTNSDLNIFVNDNVTSTNYYRQHNSASGTVISPSRSNTADIVHSETGSYASIISQIKLTNSGYYVSQNNSVRKIGTSSVIISQTYDTSTFTMTTMIKLQIKSNIANAIGIGSRFTLYKLK